MARVIAVIGVVQKSPILTPGVANRAPALLGDSQVAPGHELAAGRGGDALHLGDHRLRDLAQQQHHAVAAVKNILVVPGPLSDHLLQVVPRAEVVARRPDDQDLDHLIRCHPTQGIDHLVDHLPGEDVDFRGVVQGDGADSTLAGQEDLLVRHAASVSVTGEHFRGGCDRSMGPKIKGLDRKASPGTKPWRCNEQNKNSAGTDRW
jgi:hypothetical protein